MQRQLNMCSLRWLLVKTGVGRKQNRLFCRANDSLSNRMSLSPFISTLHACIFHLCSPPPSAEVNRKSVKNSLSSHGFGCSSSRGFRICIRLARNFLRFFLKYPRTTEKVLEVSIVRVYKGSTDSFRTKTKSWIWMLILN